MTERILEERGGLTTTKYRYHWQTGSGKLIKRWDNAPHHPEIDTFPDHLQLLLQRNLHLQWHLQRNLQRNHQWMLSNQSLNSANLPAMRTMTVYLENAIMASALTTIRKCALATNALTLGSALVTAVMQLALVRFAWRRLNSVIQDAMKTLTVNLESALKELALTIIIKCALATNALTLGSVQVVAVMQLAMEKNVWQSLIREVDAMKRVIASPTLVKETKLEGNGTAGRQYIGDTVREN